MDRNELVTSPHRHDGSNVPAVMLKVIIALVPGILCYTWYFGYAVLLQCILAISFALAIEAIMLKIRKRSLDQFLADGSAVVTAVIFALMITPFTPWWVSLTGLCFGLAIAKHIYGGLGHNIFNPAVAAYIFVLLSFPVHMNNWPTTGPAEVSDSPPAYTLIFTSPFSEAVLDGTGTGMDGSSGATYLADMQNQLESMAMISEIRENPVYGRLAGTNWEWINLAYLLGGIGLLVTGVISWHIPVAVLGSLFFISISFTMYNPDLYAPGFFHLFAGGSMLGAFFVATDPVTAANSPRGQIIYGCLIGMLIYVIRVWGAFPDGVAFAVLIANGFVPLIDRYTRPRVIGES